MSKPTHAKPALYAHIYEQMKEIAKSFGYCLLIHGSMNRDLDLVAVPWFPNFTFNPNRTAFILKLMECCGGTLNDAGSELSPGRFGYVINLNRGGYKGDDYFPDTEWYIDISVFESYTELKAQLNALKLTGDIASATG